jgi:ABC-type transport system involved in multi-copper enzyme maturation permease subunit
MATATTAPAPPPPAPWWLPWLGLAGWVGGGVGLWFLAKTAGWNTGSVVLAGCVWVAVLALAAAATGELGRLFGPVFWYEMTRLGRKKSTFYLRWLYVVAVMGLLGFMYLVWLEDYARTSHGGSSGPPTGSMVRGAFCLFLTCVVALAGVFAVGRKRPRVMIGGLLAVGLLVVGGGVILVVDSGSGGSLVQSNEMSKFANSFFGTFMVLQYLVVSFLTPAYVAGCITDEKERKTLEFLLATDLRSREIVFGKLAARVTKLLMYVLAGLPVVAFLQLFGGIDPNILLAGVAVTLITVLALAALSVYFSTTLKRARDAIALTYLAAFVYIVGTGFLAGYMLYLEISVGMSGGSWVVDIFGYLVDLYPMVQFFRPITDWLAAGNVPYALFKLMVGTGLGSGGFSYDSLTDEFAKFALFWLVVGGLLFLYAVARLRPIALGHNLVAKSAAEGGGKKGRKRVPSNRPVCGDDPMFWKEVFVDGGMKGGAAGWVLGALIIGLVFMIPLIIAHQTLWEPSWSGNFSGHWRDFVHGINVWCRGATGVLGGLLLLGAAVRGSGCVSGERDKDTWISLVGTPLGAWEMLRGKWLGCILGLRRGYFVLLLVWAFSLLVGAAPLGLILLDLIHLAVYVSAFAWIGILFSIRATTTLRATIRSLLVALFVVGGFWVVFMLCCIAPLELMLSSRSTPDMKAVFQLLAGLTPPLVMGWLPLDPTDDRGDLGLFDPDDDGIGLLAPVFGFGLWCLANLGLGYACWHSFRQVTNRIRDHLTPARPSQDGWRNL